MSYVGDYNLSETFHHRFTTVNSSGLPTTLGNTPSAEYYVNGGTTGFISGLTLTADFNSRTGLNSIAVICTTSATGLASGVNVSVQVAAGTVSGVSLIGYPIIEYSIRRRSPLMPATGGRTLLVAVTGGAAIDWANVGNPGSTVNLDATTLFVATSVTNNVGAVVTAVNTIVPARITAQGIDVGAIVTAINTNVGAIVTAFNTIAPANVTAFSTVIAANVTAYSTVIAANVTAASTAVPARVTVISASGLASLFLTDSGTTYASAVAGSPVKEIADNAGGVSLTVSGIAAGVWDEDATAHQTQGSFGQTVGDSGADATTLYANVTASRAKVTGLTFTSALRVDANIKAVADVTVTGFGTVGNTWGP